MLEQSTKAAAEPVFAFDRKVRDLLIPYQQSMPVRIASRISEIGDQPQMRMLAGGVFAAGLIRSDGRMMRAGIRMILAHELATAMKSFIKHRVDRARPRRAADEQDQEPHKGKSAAKEDTSFPSGHSSGALAVACAFSREYPAYRGLATGAAAAVAIAQIPRCAHYPSDVAAGLLIGAAAELMVNGTVNAAAAIKS